MKKIPMLEKFAAQSLVEYDGELIFSKEKFAELIVKECMQVASPNYMSTPEDSVYYVEQAINRIAEHFGVEEK
jgi:hypothetical protein